MTTETDVYDLYDGTEAEIASSEGQKKEEPAAVETTPANGGEGSQQQQRQEPTNQFPNLKEIFGEEFDDLEKVKSAWKEKQTNAEELTGLRRAKEELEAKLSDTSSVFADEDVLAFNNYVRSTGQKDFEIFNRIRNHDLTKDPIDTLVLKEVMDNPALKGKEELVKKRIMKQYEVDPEVFSADEIELGGLNVQKAAEAAATAIKSVQEKLAEKPQPIKKIDPEVNLGEWSKAIGEELDSLTSFEIPVKRGDKVEKLLDYAITPELKTKYKEHLAQVFAGAGAVTPEVRNKVIEVTKARFLSDNLPEIIHAVERKVHDELTEKYDKEYNGFKLKGQPGQERQAATDNEDYSFLD